MKTIVNICLIIDLFIKRRKKALRPTIKTLYFFIIFYRDP